MATKSAVVVIVGQCLCPRGPNDARGLSGLPFALSFGVVPFTCDNGEPYVVLLVHGVLRRLAGCFELIRLERNHMRPAPPSPARQSVAKDSHTYTRQQKWLHWISALVILWATVTGFMVTALSHRSAWRQFIDAFNPQITTVLMPLFAWRIVVAIREGKNQPVSALSDASRIARYAHILLYATVSAVLISGALMMTHGMKLLGLLPLPQLITSLPLLAALFVFHQIACMGLAGLIVLHLAAVVKHCLKGTPVLPRMM